jgi:predicted nuclease with TOPRIM domain
MTDEELVKMARLAQRDDRMATGALYGDLADRIEALTEQLEAARADAKEAEAYAEELEKEIELNEQEACMLEDDFIKAEKEIKALTAKLANLVEKSNAMLDAFCVLETQRQVEAYDSMCATLAEIEGEKT